MGEAARILREPAARNTDVRQYVQNHPSLSWLHALRERRYENASATAAAVALDPQQGIPTRRTLLSIARLMNMAADPATGTAMNAPAITMSAEAIDAHLELVQIQGDLDISAVVNTTWSNKLKRGVPLGPDELLNCLFDRVDQLVHGAERGWEGVAARQAISDLAGAIEVGRQVIRTLWDELQVEGPERAGFIQMVVPEVRFDEALLEGHRVYYEELTKRARPARCVNAIRSALAVAHHAETIGAYSAEKREQAHAKTWATCIVADSRTLVRFNQRRIESDLSLVGDRIQRESVLCQAVGACDAEAYRLTGPVLQTALSLPEVADMVRIDGFAQTCMVIANVGEL